MHTGLVMYAWLHQGIGDSKRFITELKGKLVSNFMQNWHVSINSSDRYNVYKNVKSDTEIMFLLTCPAYCNISALYIPPSHNESCTQEHFSQIMSSKDPLIIRGIARYLYLAFKHRDSQS